MNTQRNMLLLFAIGIVGLVILFLVALGPQQRNESTSISTTARPSPSPITSPVAEVSDEAVGTPRSFATPTPVASARGAVDAIRDLVASASPTGTTRSPSASPTTTPRVSPTPDNDE